MNSKINLIYLASIGRSGSTLLESMLGAHSQIATCGEIHIWPHEIAQGGVRPCSCGRSVLDCPFWIEMQQRLDPRRQLDPPIHFFRERHNAGKTIRWSRLQDFSKNPVSPQTAAQIEQFGRNNQAVFQAFLDLIQDQIGRDIHWVVDSSKDPYRLLWLVRSNLFNIKVLHVVKNPRAFIYSVTKNFQASSLKQLRVTAKQSVKWSIENYLISQVAQHHLATSDYYLVNYEKLATAPTETFESICQMIGCEFEAQAVTNFRQGSVHTIAGNPMRYETRGISLDERWKTLLPATNRRITELLTQINRSVYGYR
ncbi:sulfotransferase [Thermocoleostomius sinensis]|uniref:Sulfotransferase n=1 Tax=Thermocoleostomius sinensis A174 TaxID=2016057 RepID=A0A9E8ZC13_9CYAN|nr:sulfotransferase [Thermocoleostomius sinensis]WAL59159.1 sulfotransferase [Thermocoleostomius sinensis A174]